MHSKVGRNLEDKYLKMISGGFGEDNPTIPPERPEPGGPPKPPIELPPAWKKTIWKKKF